MHPILIEIGPITIQSLWFFISIGFIFGAIAFAKLAKYSKLKLNFILDNGLLLMLAALIGSRLFFIIFNFELFFTGDSSLISKIISVFRIWDKGLSFWGGLLSYAVIFSILCRKYGEDLKKWLDITVIALLVGFIFGHIGAFLDGINHGRETNLPWGILIQSPSVKYAVPIHPTQLYALIYTAGILIFLKKASKIWIVKKDGLTAKTGITFYAFFRFVEEFFRGDDTLMLFSILRLSQIIALLIFIALTYHQFFFKKNN